MTASTTEWPAVRPEVVAEVVAGLSARLQKRLDGAAAKLAGRPVERTGDDWRIAVDEETELVLHAPGGVVGEPAGVRCGCLLAPACVHRAAAVTVCRLADADAESHAEADGEADADADADEADGRAVPPTAVPPTAVPPTAEPAEWPRPVDSPTPADSLTPAERAAAHHLHHAAAAVLAAGVGGTGAVLQAELLRAAHRARLAGLHRPAAAAVAVVTRVRAARSGEPDHRLADLVAGLRELLDLTTALTAAVTAVTTVTTATASPAVPPALPPGRLAELRGSARQAYHEAGGLRLYGLFTEPVLTATHAGVLTWAMDAGGRLSTVAEVMPHADATAAAPQAVGAANRVVRLGDAMLGHAEFGRAGLAVQGATRSANGRLGAGAAVRAVRAAGAAWTAEPLAALWAEPPAAQVERALSAAVVPYESRPAGSDLLFLDVTLLGAAPYGPTGVPQLLADCGGGLVVALRAAHDHPGLAFRGNLALLATAPGLRLRVIGRLERAARPELHLLAVGTPPGAPQPGDPRPGDPQRDDRAPDEPALALNAARSGRVNLGLERLQTADLVLPAPRTDAVTPSAAADPPGTPGMSEAPEAPVHLLTRRVEQAVTGGRQALALGGGTPDGDATRLRSAGLATGATLLDALRASAADQPRDVFGRVVADDHEAFTAAWLAAACYGEELATALCAAAWSGGEGS
ncbi:hypothetical protein [Kitasatospora sp. A2-31]|uniref:hypothetical protein n=1 Tax=Kitasatospora sp. A2-31 TaxID=2916414 RepID=UPI001EEA9EB6|nr:hypothetical protein [Kitasatospora sp. A2-31]MCG6495868.1 hypothetical protein [Kitasatospora sp. A2-31]